MNDVNAGNSIPGTVAYRLGVLGTIAADRFAAAIDPLDLKPKHVGLMAALDANTGASQQDLATRLGVVPSLIVSLADHLERLGAIRRERDATDRRRQTLALTDQGRQLLTTCEQAATEVDATLTARLTPHQLQSLQEALAILATDTLPKNPLPTPPNP
ncbi:MarR family winged helix-turn-helix transcriptional regulator [Nocardia sp. NPDC020380]|uniref:MarR family winged helix-turn-helix transcriptional regulator n=1 Tax=Nocardia sp. NPDC020380 TaxID=3364309 RepID=UPI00378AE587